MPQTKQSPSTTTLTTSGAQIDIYTYYSTTPSSYGHLLSALIVEIPTSLDGVAFIEGELALRFDHVNHTPYLDFIINSNGELIALSYDAAYPASGYAIEPSTGQLQITIP